MRAAALALPALLLAAPVAAQSGRDTTIYTATRVITASSGKVTSVSVAKVALPSRVDTVKIPTPGLPVYVYWQPDVLDFVVRWKYALTSSTPPAPVVLPRPPSGSPVRLDSVFVYLQTPPSNPLAGGDTLAGVAYSPLPDGSATVFWRGHFVGTVRPLGAQWRASLYVRGQTTMPLRGDFPTQLAAVQALVPIGVSVSP